MSHLIHENCYGQLERLANPWHRIVTATWDPSTEPERALQLIHGDIPILAVPVFIPSYSVTPENAHYTQTYLPIPGRKALVRPKTNQEELDVVLDIVGQDYELVQGADFARMLNPLVREAHWKLETAMVLRSGAQTVFCFDCGGYQVNHDDYQARYVASEAKDGQGLDFFNTDRRVVCDNTFHMAKASGKQKLSIPHYRGCRDEMDWAMLVVAKAALGLKQFKEQMEALGRAKLDDYTAADLLDQIFVPPAMPARMRRVQELQQGNYVELTPELRQEMEQLGSKWEDQLVHQRELRNATWQIYQNGSQYPVYSLYRGTRYDLLNTITEVESHRMGKGSRKVDESLLFGTRAQTIQRATKVLVEA